MGCAVFKSGLDLDGIKFEPSELVLVSGRRPVVCEFNGIDRWRRDELGTVDSRDACSKVVKFSLISRKYFYLERD